MADDYTDEVLDAAVKIIRPLVLSQFSSESCVTTARVTIDVLDYFGVAAVPIPVEVTIFNAEGAALLHSMFESSDDPATFAEFGRVLAAIPASAPGGPWSMGLGVVDRPGDPGAGHVVVALPARGEFLDLSLDQASRPHKHMALAPQRLTGVPGAWFEEPLEVVAFEVAQAGSGPAEVSYRHSPVCLYKRSPNWRRQVDGSPSPAFAEIAGAAIRGIRDLVGPPRG